MTKITIDRATVEQALAQLEINHTNFSKGPSKSICKMLAGGNNEAIAKLRAALAEQPAQQQEPVAWRYKIVDCFGRPVWTLKTPKTDTRVLESQPLYANPQTIDKSAAIRIATALGWESKKEWVGLTKEDRYKAIRPLYRDDATAALAACHSNDEYEAIEATLKEKNT